MLDTVISGGTVVDGTGGSGTQGRCRHNGRPDREDRLGGRSSPDNDRRQQQARHAGFIDVHTHFDARSSGTAP